MRVLSLLLGFALVYASGSVLARVPNGTDFGWLWYWWVLATVSSGLTGACFIYQGAIRGR